MKRKLIAFILVVALIIGVVPSTVGNVAKASGSVGTGYTELSLDDFGISTYKEMLTDGETVQTETKASLNGVAVTGVYKLFGNASFFVGKNWEGVQVSVYETTLCLIPVSLGNTNSAVIYFNAADFGYDSWKERNIELCMSFDFANVNGDKADVVVKATVDDCVPKAMTLVQATTTSLYQSIGVYLPDEDSKVIMTEPEYLIKRLTMRNFGVDTYKEMATDGEFIQTESKATLDGTMVTGVYRFSGAGQLFIGENWHAVQLSIYETTLCVIPSLLENTNNAALYFNAADFGYTSWLDRNVQISMSFDFKNISGNKADVVVKVAVDDRMPREMILEQATTTTLYQNIGVYIPDANSAVTVMTQEYAITELSLDDFGVGVTKTLKTDGEFIQTESKGTLDGTAVTGIYCFEGAPQVFIGENWHAITLSVYEESFCVVPTLLDNTNADAALYFNISDFGYTTWTERNIKVRVAFDFKNISGNKADVIVKVTVDDLVTKEMTLKQATITSLYQNVGVYIPDTNSKVTLTNPNYTPETVYDELSLKDFGISTFETVKVDGTVIKTASEGTLDGNAVTGLYKMFGDAQFFIGESWKGLHVSVYSDPQTPETLSIMPYALGNSNTAALYFNLSEFENYTSWKERDIKIRAAFEFVNVTGNKADVVVKVTVDDFVTKTMILENADIVPLCQSIGVYLPNANSKITFTNPGYKPVTVHEELSLKNFGISHSKNITTDGTIIKTASEGTLDGKAVTGLYKLFGDAQFFIGESWKGLHVSVYSDPQTPETLSIMPYALGNSNTAALYFNLSEFENYTSWKERDIKIRTAFEFRNVSGEKADVVVEITIDDVVMKTMILEDANIAPLCQSIGVYLPNADSTIVMTEPNPDPEPTYEELSLKDFGINTFKNIKADGTVIKTANEGTLNGKAITSLYKIFGDAQFFIGESWKGLHVSVYSDPQTPETLSIVPYALGNSNTTALYFALSEFENYTSWKERDIKIRTAFEFKNVSGNKADVVVKVTIDDAVTKTMILENADTAPLCQSIGVYLPNANSTITLTNPGYKPITVYEELSLKDFGIHHSKNIKTDGAVIQTPTKETLDGKSVTGLYKMFGDAQFFIGESWKGLHVSVYSDPQTPETLCIMPYALGNSNSTALYFALSEFENYTSWKERDIKIRAAFEFRNVSGEKADVVIEITIDDVVMKTMILEDANIAPLCQSIGVYLPNAGSTITMTEPNPDPEPTYELFTLNDYGFKGYTLVSDETVLKEMSSEETLDGTCITGDYKFSPNGSIVCFGGYWTGVRIQSLDNGKFEIRFQLDGTEQYVDDVFNNIILTPEDAGMTLTDRIINLKMGFEVTEQNGTMGTLVVRMTIDNSFTQQYTFKNVPLAYTKQIMMAWSSTNGTVVLNASDPIPEAPTVNPTFKQLTFDSYLVYSGVYGYNGGNDLLASGNCGLDSLDKVVFTDTINITDKPGANLYIGGKANGWEGLLLGSAENGNLVLVYDGQSILFTSAKAGVQLTDNDVKITFSFEYVDADEDGAKDDVKLGVWFNGKAYNNKWIYLNDYAEKLGGFIGVYSAVEGATLTVKTYNAPIDFAEWGFTKDWAKTLGLI